MQYLTVTALLGLLILVDFMFLEENTFVFDPNFRCARLGARAPRSSLCLAHKRARAARRLREQVVAGDLGHGRPVSVSRVKATLELS
jgi:hypothetical protein